MTTNTTFNKDAEERLNDPADQPNTRANVCQETRKALLAATPERFAAGGRAVKLSEAARLMRSLNALPFHDIEPTIRAAGITEQEALSGCDELSAALGGVLHAAAKRTIELPEWSAGQFARLCSSADCAQKSSAEPAVSGASLTVAGNIDIEGLTTKAAMELPEQPCLRSAAPVKSLLEGGALLSAVAHAGEFLGLLSPDAPGRSIMGGHPVNALNGEWRTGGAAAAAANLVAAGASAGALVLGRPSDAGESAIRAGVSAFRPAQSLFNSQEGFASSWRFDGWSGIARRARDAFAIAWTASAHEGVDPDSGMGRWQYPGFIPTLMSKPAVAKWRKAVLEPRRIQKAVIAVSDEWQSPEWVNKGRELAAALEKRGITVELSPSLPEDAAIVDWMTWLELEPQLEDFLTRRYALTGTFDLAQLLMMLTLSDRLKRDGWSRRRMVQLIKRNVFLISPYGAQIARTALPPVRDLLMPEFTGTDKADVLIWLGAPKPVDASGWPFAALPLKADPAAKCVRGAFVIGLPGEEGAVLAGAELLESVREEVFGAEDFHISTEPAPEDLPAARLPKDSDQTGEHQDAGAAASAQEEKPNTRLFDDLAAADLGALAHAAWDAEKQGAKVSVLDAETGAPLTIEDFEAKLNELIETFRKAAADADDDDDASDDADNDEETPQQAQSDDAAENLIEIASPASLALAANEINAVKAAEADAQAAESSASPAEPALSAEDRAWLDAFFPGAAAKAPDLAKVGFLRRFLKEPMPDLWRPTDNQWIIAWVKFWLFRHDAKKVERAIDRIPEAHQTFETREQRVLGLFLKSDIKAAAAAAQAIEPQNAEEAAVKEWMLGMSAQRQDDDDAAIEHYQRARALSSTMTAANFPLAQALLKKYGSDHPQYQEIRKALESEAPTGLQLLLSEEERVRRASNFEKVLLPALKPGVFSAELLLAPAQLVFDKKLFSEELWRAWNLAVTDRTPDDPDRFTLRIGTLEGSIRLIHERLNSTSLATAARKSPFTRSAETLLLCHAGYFAVELRGNPTEAVEAATFFAQILAALCRTAEPLGVFALESLQKPGFYIEAAQPAKHGQMPILSVIRAGVSTDFGEDYIATYGLGAFSQPELEVDLGSFPTQAGAMLTFGIIERILSGHFTTEASSVRFGVDQENLEQRNILRAPGRVVEGEALRLVLPGEPTNDSELPQA